MINKKVLTILIMSLMFTLLVGCSSVKEYSYDYNKISEISTISLAISDAYNNSSRKSDFKKESKKIIKDLQKTKMKTKIMIAFALVMIAAFTGYNVCKVQRTVLISDIALATVGYKVGDVIEWPFKDGDKKIEILEVSVFEA